MKKILRFLSKTLAWGLWLGVFGGVVGLGIFYFYGAGLPSYQQLSHYQPPVTTRFYAKDGRPFAEYAFEKRLYVPLSAIPKQVIQAFIAAEDKNFYMHFGVDPLSILSAAIANISRIQESKRPIGASTITQQVARNFLLTEMSSRVSLERKIKEAILAFRIESAYSKEYILELYLNEIYLGVGAYGVASASLIYFNKSLKDLTLEEAAYLAGLPKGPNNYHPIREAKAAVTRRNYVLRRMQDDGVISPAEAKAAMEKPLVTRERQVESRVAADFFAEEVRRELSAKYGESCLYKEGFVVRTTLDPDLQVHAEAALQEGLRAYDRQHGWRGPLHHLSLSQGTWQKDLSKLPSPPGMGKWKMAVVLSQKPDAMEIGLVSGEKGTVKLDDMTWARKYISADERGPVIKKTQDVVQVGDVILVSSKENAPTLYALQQIPKISGALMCMDAHTGSVLAMQGGYSFQLSQYNRATQAYRQTGSSFKTFVYLAALEKGLTPSHIIDDAPFSINMGYGLGIWRPNNYDRQFKGPLTLRRGFELSRNLVTVRMTHFSVGMKRVVDMVQRMGIIDHMPKQLAMVLGAGETTLEKMVRGHGVLVNGGRDVRPTFIQRIQDRHGKTVLARQDYVLRNAWADESEIPLFEDTRPMILDPATSYQMVSLLEGAVQRGTGRHLLRLNRPVGGKSGTTNDFKDAWFIALTPNWVVGVYIGFDQPSYLGRHHSGGRVAAPIVANFLEKALENVPPTPFPVPKGIKLVRVDPATGRASSGPGSILEAFKTGTETVAKQPFQPECPEPCQGDGGSEMPMNPMNPMAPEAQGPVPQRPTAGPLDGQPGGQSAPSPTMEGIY